MVDRYRRPSSIWVIRIGAGFGEVGDIAVAQDVDRHGFAEPRRFAGIPARHPKRARVKRPVPVGAGNNRPPMGATSSCTDSMPYRFRWPLSSSTRISILSPSTIGDPQPHDFGAFEAHGVGRHQRCVMLQAGHRREKSHHLFRARDYGELLRLADPPYRRAHGDTVKRSVRAKPRH